MTLDIRKYILETYQDMGAYNKSPVSSTGIWQGTPKGVESSDTEDQSQYADDTDTKTPAEEPSNINHKTVDPYYSGRYNSRV